MGSLALFILFATFLSMVCGDEDTEKELIARGDRVRLYCPSPNDCLRGLYDLDNKRPPLSSRLADCSSLNVATLIPPAVTQTTDTLYVESTITYTSTTVTVQVKRGPMWMRRTAAPPAAATTTVLPTSVPGYARAYCPDAGRYYSACSCLGYTRATTTEPAETVVLASTTVTDTVTVCVAATVTAAMKRGLELMSQWGYLG